MKERSALVPLLVRFTLQWLFIILLFFIIFFFMIHEASSTVQKLVSCESYSSMFFSLKKCNKKKEERLRVTTGWTDISGPRSVSFLPRSSMYYIILTNLIIPLNVVSTNCFIEHLILHLLRGVQTSWDL